MRARLIVFIHSVPGRPPSGQFMKQNNHLPCFCLRLPKFKEAIKKEISKIWKKVAPERWQSANRTKIDISSEGKASFKGKRPNGKILERQSSDGIRTGLQAQNTPPKQRVYHVVVHNSTTVMTVTDKCTQTTSV